MQIIGNLVMFKVVWAISLAGVVFGYAWLGLAALTVFATWHISVADTPKADFLVAAVAVCIGLALDTLYIRSGLIAYQGEMFWSGAAPLWILALWANFALTLNGCLGWLRERRMMAALLAFVCGPLSYYFGIRLGTATVKGEEMILFGAIGLAWSVTVPLLLWLSLRFERRLHPVAAEAPAAA